MGYTLLIACVLSWVWLRWLTWTRGRAERLKEEGLERKEGEERRKALLERSALVLSQLYLLPSTSSTLSLVFPLLPSSSLLFLFSIPSLFLLKVH